MNRRLEKYRQVLSLGLFVILCLVAVVQGANVKKQIQLEELQKSKDRLWCDVMQHSDSAVLVVDAQTSVILDWNAGAEQLTGWSAEEVVGRTASFLLPNALHETGRKLLFSGIDSKSVTDQVLYTFVNVNTKDGKSSGQLLMTMRGYIAGGTGRTVYVAWLDNPASLTPIPLIDGGEMLPKTPEDTGAKVDIGLLLPH